MPLVVRALFRAINLVAAARHKLILTAISRAHSRLVCHLMSRFDVMSRKARPYHLSVSGDSQLDDASSSDQHFP